MLDYLKTFVDFHHTLFVRAQTMASRRAWTPNMLDTIAYVTKTMFRFIVLSDYLILLNSLNFAVFPNGGA